MDAARQAGGRGGGLEAGALLARAGAAGRAARARGARLARRGACAHRRSAAGDRARTRGARGARQGRQVARAHAPAPRGAEGPGRLAARDAHRHRAPAAAGARTRRPAGPERHGGSAPAVLNGVRARVAPAAVGGRLRCREPAARDGGSRGVERELADWDDERLLARCREADPAFVRRAVSVIAARRYPALVRYLCGWLPSREEAEDVAQQALLRLYRHARNYRPEAAKVRTWLYRIAGNLARNALRDRARRPAFSLEAIDRVVATAREDGPLERLERRELAACVREAVGELPEAFREVLLLCDLGGMSYREAAEVLELPVGTVRSRLFRARARLESRLQPLLLAWGDGTDPGPRRSRGEG
ncbi:MAG: sigma-70 family RNA polymerase sigma factor [Planctomycetota bacterium]|nr:MAG: sigma-70 family RNA polymerase sigma factor [Planctomycetota bacterium]